MAKLSIYHGISQVNKLKFLNIVRSPSSFIFRGKLHVPGYDDIMEISNIGLETEEEIKDDKVSLYSEKGIYTFIYKYMRYTKCGYTRDQINIIIYMLTRLKKEYVKMTDGVYKNYLYNILHWLNYYSECFSSDYTDIIVNGDCVTDKSMIFFDIIVRLDKRVVIIFGKNNFESVNTFEALYRTELKLCEKVPNNAADFEYVFNTKQDTKDSKLKSSVESNNISVDPWKTEKIICNVPDYKVILDIKSTLNEVEDVEYAITENMLFTAIILGHGENRDESHNEIVSLRKKLGDTNCDYIQAQLEYISNISNDEIKYVMDGFKKYGLAELKSMGDLDGKANKEGIEEVHRTSYELSKKLKNKNLVNNFRLIIDKTYEKNEAKIKTLYNVSIKVCAMCNRINSLVEKSSTLMYFKVKKELTLEEKLFFRILALSSINFIYIDWFKYTFWDDMRDIDSISIIEDNYKVIDETLYVPREFIKTKVSTVASKASKQVDTMLYDGDALGIYKDNQFKNNNSIVLSTTLDEIELLWKNETKVRPNFEVNKDNGVVTIPTIFASISGIGQLDNFKYSEKIKRLLIGHTLFICNRHFIINNNGMWNSINSGYTFGASSQTSMYMDSSYNNTYQVLSNCINYNGVINRNEIKSYWKYHILNDDKQDLLINKIDELCKNLQYMKDIDLDDVAIAISNIPDSIINDILWFDFTKMSPKIVMVMTTQNILNKHDSIILTFCNLLGFDVAVFNPTGYKGLDGYLTDNMYESYSLGAPRLNVVYKDKRQNKGFLSSLFD